MNDENMTNRVKGVWQRRKKPLLITLFVIIGVVVVCMYAQNVGIFPGNVINRISLSSYLRSEYNDSDVDVQFREYNKVREWYEYDCTKDGVSFVMAMKNGDVRSDGYYSAFRCNKELSATMADYVEQYIVSSWTTEGVTVTAEATIDISNDANSGSSEDELLAAYGDTLSLTVTLRGDSVSFDEYKEYVYGVLQILQQKLPERPLFMQVFFRRNDSEFVDDGVLQYESRLTSYMFNFNREGLLEAINCHYYVELTDDQQQSLKYYSIIRVVNFILISVTVIVLGSLWIVRRNKKKKKYSGTTS